MGFLIVQDKSPEYFENIAKLLGKLLWGGNDEISLYVMKFVDRILYQVNEIYLWYNPPKPVKGHVAETMWNAIKESQESLERSLPNDYKNAVTKKLHNIVFDDYRSDGLCTIDLGIDSSSVKRQIADIANLTKMSEKLHDIFQSAVYVNGAGAKQAESAAIAANGSFHYILVAANRKGKKYIRPKIAEFAYNTKFSREKDYY